jgi:hypothetical protein
MDMDLVICGSLTLGAIIGFAWGYGKGYADGKRIGYHRGRSINFKSFTEVGR